MTRRSFHSVVELLVSVHETNQSVPVLFLKDGELSLYGLAWARNMLVVENKSPMHLSKAVNAAGLLFDFYVGVYGSKPLVSDEMSILMQRFFEARIYGNRLLGWKPVRRKTAIRDVRYSSEFCRFCAQNLGTFPINAMEKRFVGDLNVSSQMGHYAKLETRKTWDMLYHLMPSTSQGQGVKEGFSFDPAPDRITQKANHDYFPPDKVLQLISATENLRDKLAFLILFFGGVRESELLHLYVTDISAPDGEAKINIAHPGLSRYTWDDTFRGEQAGSRSDFLAERYELTPRNKYGLKNPLHAGWKGMLYTRKNYESDFYWLVPEIGRLFAQLHRRYIREFRYGTVDSHPYYFINLQNDQFGTALKISNLTKSFYRAAKRVGLSASDPGVNPHGARHFYGYFCASYLKIPMEKTQVMMRHAQISSTQVYYSIDERVIRDELKKGYDRLTQDIPDFITNITALVGQEC